MGPASTKIKNALCIYKMNRITKTQLLAWLVGIIIALTLTVLGWKHMRNLGLIKIHAHLDRHALHVPTSFAGPLKLGDCMIYIYTLSANESANAKSILKHMENGIEGQADYRPLDRYLFELLFSNQPQRAPKAKVRLEGANANLKLPEGTYAVHSSPNMYGEQAGWAIWEIKPEARELTLPVAQWLICHEPN